MSCNTCAKSFSLLRKERGCPGCGFSYCSKCLNHTVLLPKLNAEAKVCVKCQMAQNNHCSKDVVEPPAAYLRRLETLENPPQPVTVYTQDKYQRFKRGLSTEDQQIVDRLRQLREDRCPAPSSLSVEQQIADRLKKLRESEAAAATDDEVRARLSKLKEEPGPQSSKAVTNVVDLRTDQQKSDDLILQYMQEVGIDKSHKRAFDSRIDDIETRLNALTGTYPTVAKKDAGSDSEEEEEIVRKVIEKAKAQAALEAELSPEGATSADPATQELPWCEICNEDARMRCLGCRYLFCKQCYLEHKDEDLGCDRYEPYQKPRNVPA